MADYTDKAQIVGSREIPRDGTKVDFAVSGKPRFRRYYSQTRRKFLSVHDMTTAEKTALLAFYETNKDVAFTFDWQGDSPYTQYTVRFAGPPKVVPLQGDGRYKVTSTLYEV